MLDEKELILEVERLHMRTAELEAAGSDRDKILDVIENSLQRYEDIVLPDRTASARSKAWHKAEALKELLEEIGGGVNVKA